MPDASRRYFETAAEHDESDTHCRNFKPEQVMAAETITGSQSADHATLAEKFNKDEPRVDWHDDTLWFIRKKRDKAAWQIPEWEELREAASQIKNNVLGNLHSYLTEFEKHARENGVHVHWATDAEEHNKIVYGII